MGLRRHILLAGCMASALPAFAAAKPNPADYPLNARVRATRLTYACNSSFLGNPSSCGMRLLIEAVVDGKKLELRANTSILLRTGDYKAKQKVDASTAGNSVPDYVDERAYEFLFPDNKVMTFQVVGESDE